MQLLRTWDLLVIALSCTVASLTSTNVEAEVKVQTLSDDHRQGTHKGHGHGNLGKPASLETELRQLRNSINANRQNIASLQQRGGQIENPVGDVEDELTEVRPLDIPLHHHEPDDVTEYRRYATTTIRSLDTDMPMYEDMDDDDDDESSEQSDDSIEQKKRNHDEDVDGDVDDDDDDDDDDEDDDDEGEVDDARKKKSVPSDGDIMRDEQHGDVGVDDAHGIGGSSTIRPTTRDALVRDLNAFLGKTGKELHEEADFQGVSKLNQIREIEKRVNIPLKEKYVNAVDPKADEDLLELMVKIAENPREWQNVHGILEQLEEDLITSRDVVNNADMLEQKRRDNSDKVKQRPNKLTKEERKQQQAEAKKRKKKKQREKVARLERERQNKNKIEVKEKSPEELRREQLERAGLLAPSVPLMKNQQKGTQTFTTKSVTTSTTQSPVTVASKVTTQQPPQRERYTIKGNQIKPIGSSFDYLSKNQPRVILHPDENPRPKSPMQELREKWPKPLASVEKNKNPSKAIVHGRLKTYETNKPSKPNNRIRFAETSNARQDSFDNTNSWSKSKSNTASRFNEDTESMRANFLKEVIAAKSHGAVWKPNTKSKWSEIEHLPVKDIRTDRNNYFNPSYDQINMPVLSVDALKHGNVMQASKTWPRVSLEQNSGRVQNTWPQLPADPNHEVDIDNWPDFSATPMVTSKNTQWSRYTSQLDPTNNMANTWPNTPLQKAQMLPNDPVKEVVNNANNKQWPHFAYHRVTSSPQSLARQQKEAQQRARHRNAYIAVSIIAPPGKNRTMSASNSKQNNKSTVDDRFNQTRKPPLTDKMDDLLEDRGQKLIQLDPLEEQLIDMAAYGSSGKFGWDHSQHLDKLKEQLKTLSAMEDKLRLQWMEKERLRQILNDASKRGASYYREHRDAGSSVRQHATSPPNSNIVPLSDTTHS